MRDPVFIVATLAAVVLASEWLCRRGIFRHIGSALMVIVLGAVLSNSGIIPAGSTDDNPVPVYDAIFAYLAPVSIFWLLLSVNLRDVLRTGGPLLVLFVAGAAGTVAGAMAAHEIVQAARTLGPLSAPLAGMFVGTYIGGSVNFNAIALHYNVVREGALYGGAMVVDNIATALWIAVTLLLPRVLLPLWRARVRGAAVENSAPIVELAAETESVTPARIAAVIALGAAGLWVSSLMARFTAGLGFAVPTILIVTTLALVLAQIRVFNRMVGTRALAMFAVYVFLAVIGAFCDVRALPELGAIGVTLLAFVLITVSVHGVVMLVVAYFMRSDLASVAVASQANVGGATSAIALAKSLGREDLLVPGVLLGALGNAIGTFAGFAAVGWLRA